MFVVFSLFCACVCVYGLGFFGGFFVCFSFGCCGVLRFLSMYLFYIVITLINRKFPIVVVHEVHVKSNNSIVNWAVFTT